jgi:hypothetical protein
MMNSLFHQKSIDPSQFLKSLEFKSNFSLRFCNNKFITDFFVAICTCKIIPAHVIFYKCSLPTKEFLKEKLNRDQLDLLTKTEYLKQMTVELNETPYVSSKFLGFNYKKLQKTNIFNLIVNNKISLTELKSVESLTIEDFDYQDFDNDSDNYLNIDIYYRIATFLSYHKNKITSIQVAKRQLQYFDTNLNNLSLTIKDLLSFDDLPTSIELLKKSKIHPKLLTLYIAIRDLQYDAFIDIIKRIPSTIEIMCFLHVPKLFDVNKFKKYLESHNIMILLTVIPWDRELVASI